MGEVATTLKAFESQLYKAIDCVPQVRGEASHDSVQLQYVALSRVDDVISQYCQRLSSSQSVLASALLQAGEHLERRQLRSAAHKMCYSRILKLHFTSVHGKSQLECLSYHVQACIKASQCLANEAPNHLNVQLLQEAIDLAVEHLDLYWLVHNAAVATAQISKRMIVSNQSESALPHIIRAILAMEAHSLLQDPQFLSLRITLVDAACSAYTDMQHHELALKLIEHMTKQVNDAEQLLALDPVPQSQSVQNIFAASKDQLNSLKMPLEVRGSANVTEVVEKLSVLSTDRQRVVALLDTLSSSSPRERVRVWQAALKPEQKVAMEALRDIVVPKATAVLNAVNSVAEREASASAAAAEAQVADTQVDEAQAAQTGAEGHKEEGLVPGADVVQPPSVSLTDEETEAISTLEATLPPTLHAAVMISAYMAGEAQSKLFSVLEELARARCEQVNAVSMHTQPRAAEAGLAYHLKFGLAYRLYNSAHTAPEQRTRSAGVGAAHDQEVAGKLDQLNATSALLTALQDIVHAEKSMGTPNSGGLTEALLHLADVLTAHADKAKQLMELYTDCAARLWLLSRPLLDGVMCCRDKEAPTVTQLLAALHIAFEETDYEDSIMRLGVSQKLALLHAEAGSLDAARTVLLAAQRTAGRARSACNRTLEGREDERFRVICASRSHPDADVSKHAVCMTVEEQILANMHADIFMLLADVQLRIGVQDQAARAIRASEKKVAALQQRKEQVALLGTLTRTEERRLSEAIAAAAECRTNCPATERSLMAAAGKNPYQKALLLIRMAPFQSDQHMQVRLLSQAADAIRHCEALERDLTCAATAPVNQKERRTRPRIPLIVNRTETTLDVSHFPMHLKGGKATHFAVYCKPFGAGVDLNINATTAQYDGTGTLVPIGDRITIKALQPHDTYMIAIAAYDAKGHLIGDLGESSQELPICLPLPTMSAWAALALQAYSLNLVKVARPAVSVLQNHFIMQGQKCPVWQAHPMDCIQLSTEQAASASPGLLRAFSMVSYVHAGRSLATLACADSLSDRSVSVHSHVERLRLVKLLLVGMQAAVYSTDEMLLLQGIVDIHNAVLPLLHLSSCPAELLAPLMHVHTSVQMVRNLVQDSLEDQEAMRETTARAAATLSMHLWSLAGGQYANVPIEKKIRADAAALKVPLLAAYDRNREMEGRPITAARWISELEALQDMILRAAGGAADSQMLSSRIADSNDLVCRTLTSLAGTVHQPEVVWESLQAANARSHERWAELCMRTMHAATLSGAKVPYAEWCKTLVSVVTSAAEIPTLQFRKLGVDSQMMLVPDAELPAHELDEIRQKVASEADVSVEELDADSQELAAALDDRNQFHKRRNAAASILQARIPVYLKRQAEKRQASLERRKKLRFSSECWSMCASMSAGDALSAARAFSADTLAEGEPPGDTEEEWGEGPNNMHQNKSASEETSQLPEAVLQLLRCITRSSQHALRSQAWLQVINAAIQAWNALRAIADCAPCAITMHAGAARWVLTPTTSPPLESKVPVTDGNINEAGKEDVEVPGLPTVRGRWSCEAAPENIPRLLRPIVEALLDVVEGVKTNEICLATGPQPVANEHARQFTGFPAGRPRTPGAPVSEPYEGSVLSMGSDAPPSAWILANDQIDYSLVNRMILATVSALTGAGRAAAALSIGCRWAALSDGVYDESIMPACLAAAPRAGSNVQPFASALSKVLSEKKEAFCALDAVRRMALATFGERDHLVVSADVLKRHCRPKNSHKSGVGSDSGARSLARASSTRSGFSRASTVSKESRITSQYEEVIKTLQAAAETHAQALACNEMGDVLIQRGDIPQATAAWNDSLDLILGPYQAIKNWRTALASEQPVDLLARHGIRTLLFTGASLCGKLVRISYPRNLHQQVEAAALGSLLLTAILPSSLSHPQRAIDTAAYIPAHIGADAQGDSSVTGSDVFRDPYELNLQDVLCGLESVSRALVNAGLPLEALVPLALWDWAAYRVAHNCTSVMRCRLLRVEALCALGRARDAYNITMSLMRGENLPSAHSSNDMWFQDKSGKPLPTPAPLPEFVESSLPGSAENTDAIKSVMSGGIHPVIEDFYGPWVCAHIALARAKLLLLLGGIPCLWTGPIQAPLHNMYDGVQPACTPPNKIEKDLLLKAQTLLGQVVAATCSGQKLLQPAAQADEEAPVDAHSGKGAKAAKPSKPAKGASAAPEPLVQSTTDDIEIVCDIEAWHVDVLFRARFLLAEVAMRQWLPAEGLRQLHFIAVFMHRSDALAANGDGTTPSDILTFQVSAHLWLSVLYTRCCALLEAHHCKLAASAADELASASCSAGCKRKKGAAFAIHGAIAAAQHETQAAVQSFSSAQGLLAQASDTTVASADVLVSLGDLHVSTGAKSKARKVWELAADILSHDAEARGLSEEQAAAELVNIYATDREVLTDVLVKAAWGSAICGDLGRALVRIKEAAEVLPLCRAGPILHSRVAFVYGQLMCRVNSSAIHAERFVAFDMLSHAASTACVELPCTYPTACSSLLQSAMFGLREIADGSPCIKTTTPAIAAAVEKVLSKARELSCMRTLLESCTDIGLPELSSLPDWLLVRMKAADALHMAQSGRMKPAADDTELQQASWRTLCNMCNLSPGTGFANTSACEHESTALHATIKAMVPKYVETCCVKDVAEVSNAITGLKQAVSVECCRKGANDGSQMEGLDLTPHDSVHVQWVIDEIPGQDAEAPPGGADAHHGKNRKKISDGKRGQKERYTGKSDAEAAAGLPECTWVLITVCRSCDNSWDTPLVGAIPVESARLQSTLRQVRLTRLRLEAHSEGNAGMLLQGIDVDGAQPPSGGEQRSTLEAVIKVLWSVTSAHEEDPDCRSMIDAVLHPSEPPPKDIPEEEAGEQAETAQDSPPHTANPPVPTADTPAGQDNHTEDRDASKCRIVWPQTDVEFWKLVEGMLDLHSGCAVVGNKDFNTWISSALLCRPDL